jgi:lycopene cyclase domain-containing protein
MPASSHGYIFLELAAIAYLVGFGAQYLRLPRRQRTALLISAAALMLMWFVLDEVAIAVRIWTFPQGGTLPFRLFNLPAEEYLGFLLHTTACYALAVRSAVRR